MLTAFQKSAVFDFIICSATEQAPHNEVLAAYLLANTQLSE
ncbi:hypothetical protein [Paenibacillus ihuae]|nr:hypothetical protein [Paenibacillus ihuae]